MYVAKNRHSPFSEFAADTAGVWSKYLKTAKDLDDRLVKQWNNELDSLLIFVG